MAVEVGWDGMWGSACNILSAGLKSKKLVAEDMVVYSALGCIGCACDIVVSEFGRSGVVNLECLCRRRLVARMMRGAVLVRVLAARIMSCESLLQKPATTFHLAIDQP
jgi:hypothetical protein